MNKIKLIVGLFLIFGFGCQNVINENAQSKSEPEFSVSWIDPLNDEGAQNILREALTNGYNKTSTSIDSLLGTIDYSEAIVVQQEEGGISRYTFTLNTDDALSYENLIVQVNEFGEYGAMILKYEPSINWLIENDGTYQEDDFTGTIRLLTIDGSEFNRVEMISGEGEYTPVTQTHNKLMKMNCESGPGSNGGGGSSGEGGPESGGDSGDTGNDGGSGTGDSSGNSSSDGGGSNCVWVIDSSGVSLIDCDYDINVVDGGMEPIEEEPTPGLITKSISTCEAVEAPTIGDGDVIGTLPSDGSISLDNVLNLISILETNTHLLIELSCDELENWLDLAEFEISNDVIQILNDLSDDEWLVLNPYNQWDIQELSEAKGSSVNMDYFAVNVILPFGYSANDLLNTIRLNMNSFIDNSFANFAPFNDYNNSLWNSDSYLGAIIHIDMGNNSPWLGGGYNFIAQPDDGSVIVSDVSENYWRFSTIQAPGDFQHPVSGTREFGYFQNPNGSYTFYSRGTDRATGIIDNIMQENLNVIFSKADDLWSSFQDEIADHVNSNGGTATVLEPEINRPDWELLDSYIQGEISFNELQTSLGCHEN